MLKTSRLVANIEDKFILGMDLMNKGGFELDFKNGVLKTNSEELVMHSREDVAARVVLAKDTPYQIEQRL